MGEEEARQGDILPIKKQLALQHMAYTCRLSYQYDLSTAACSFYREELCLVQRKPCTDSQETRRMF
jgi:hypothetical protein